VRLSNSFALCLNLSKPRFDNIDLLSSAIK
jgi:hypothetical protein